MKSQVNHIILIIICTLLCLPIGVVLGLSYSKWKKNDSENTLNAYQRLLSLSLAIILVEITILAVWFYPNSYQFIHVMGTFY